MTRATQTTLTTLTAQTKRMPSMPIRNLTDRWGSVSIGLHWLTLILIVGLAPVGYLMQDLPNGPFKIQVFALHKSFGLTVLALTGLRLLWRLFAGAPVPVPN